MPLRKMIRRKHLPDYLPFGPTQLDALLKDRKLPLTPVKLVEGGNASAFFEDEIIAYQEKLAADRERMIAELGLERTPEPTDGHPASAAPHASGYSPRPNSALLKSTRKVRR
jgi:hypothetical protein